MRERVGQLNTNIVTEVAFGGGTRTQRSRGLVSFKRTSSNAGMNDGMKSTGAIALVAAGIASAFALATCCALPILLGSAAVAFAPIAVATEAHSQLVTAMSAIGLIGSVGLAARAPRYCKPNAVCARPWFRWSIIATAVFGALLLAAAKYYA